MHGKILRTEYSMTKNDWQVKIIFEAEIHKFGKVTSMWYDFRHFPRYSLMDTS